MRAFQINEFGIERLALVERPDPSPAANEVLVRSDAWSLNYRDVMVVEGLYNPRMKLPATPLSDTVGEVVEVGAAVKRWKPGDRVMPIFAQRWFDGPPNAEVVRTALGAGPQWDGVFCEASAFDEQAVVAVPEYLTNAEAATLPCAALTAWNGLVVSGGLKAGDTVLTLGSGGVSVFALQIAKMFGAKVISTSSSDEKLGKLTDLGADEVINYLEHPQWDARVMELTGKRGVDHVVEVGGSGTLSRSVNSARIGGHVAMIGALETSGDFDPVRAFMRSIRLQGIFVGSRAMLEDMLRAFDANEVRPVIDRAFGFEDGPGALEYVRTGSHFGKIVIEH